MERPQIRSEGELKELYLKRALEFKRAAEIFQKAGNVEAYFDCLECAFLEELMAERGLKGNLFVWQHVRA